MSIEYVVDHPMIGSGLKGVRFKFEVLAQSEQDVTVDMAHVELLDVSGVGALLYVLKRLRSRQRKLVLKNLSSQPRQLLFSLKLNTAFIIDESSQPQAVASHLLVDGPDIYLGKAVGSY